MTERDLVLLPLAGKDRPAIVIRVVDDYATLIYGTGTHRPHVESIGVEPSSRGGKALRLTKATYFYATNVRVAKTSNLKRTALRCPPELFLKLRELIEGK